MKITPMNTYNEPKLVTDVLLEVAAVAREKTLRLRNERRIAQEELDELQMQRLKILDEVQESPLRSRHK